MAGREVNKLPSKDLYQPYQIRPRDEQAIDWSDVEYDNKTSYANDDLTNYQDINYNKDDNPQRQNGI